MCREISVDLMVDGVRFDSTEKYAEEHGWVYRLPEQCNVQAAGLGRVRTLPSVTPFTATALGLLPSIALSPVPVERSIAGSGYL